MVSLLVLLAGLAALLFATPDLKGAVIRAGTKLEVRLSTAAGSRISHAGDRISATVIAPILSDGPPISLSGATLSGVVEQVQCLGLGFKHGFAQLKLRFDSIQLPNGIALGMTGRVDEVETARERVDAEGGIEGIDAAANLSSGVSFVISTLLVHSELAAPAILVKLLAARSPDSEIYFPVGTELLVGLGSDLVINGSSGAQGAAPTVSQGDARASE